MKIEPKILKQLGITELTEKIDEEKIDFVKSVEYDDYRAIFLKDGAILIDDPYDPTIYQLKTIITLSQIYLIDEDIFSTLQQKITEFKNSSIELDSNDSSRDKDKDTEMDDTKVSKILQSIFARALKQGVSDIHILPKPKHLSIQFRRDGDMGTYDKLPKSYAGFLVNKLKTMGKMDITNSMIPQDGKIKTKILNANIELRISTCPTVYGENAVMRVQQSDNLFDIGLPDLGFMTEQLEAYRKNFSRPYGMILNVGATGSGKSTTFYLTIDELVKKYEGKKNIMTVEDPVEIKYEGITQIEADDRQGRGFNKVLKALLRQDPDIVLIGEIRDEDTAQIRARASLTGHLVLATLHANDSFNAITRLRDLGVKDPLIASTSNCFLSQRLIKKICPHCRVEKQISEEEKEKYLLKEYTVYESPGCDKCNNTGYKGRTALVEVLEIDEDIKSAISNGLSEVEIKKIAKTKNFQNNWRLGVTKLHQGEICLRDLVTIVNRDTIINSPEEEVIIDNRFVLYPEKDLKVKIKNKIGNIFDISKRGLSIIFEHSYLMEINKEIEVQIDGKNLIFIPKSYGKMGNKFLVGGIYKGDLSYLSEDS